jgi:chemotaxis protein histidine kinase CheA
VHGGSAPQVRRRAAERVAEAKARAAAERYISPDGEILEDPVSELLKLAHEARQFQAFVSARVEALSAESWRYEARQGEQLRAEVALLERAMDRCGRLLTDINRLGLLERAVRLREAQASLVVSAVIKVLDDLDLSPDQRVIAQSAVPARLRELEAMSCVNDLGQFLGHLIMQRLLRSEVR